MNYKEIIDDWKNYVDGVVDKNCKMVRKLVEESVDKQIAKGYVLSKDREITIENMIKVLSTNTRNEIDLIWESLNGPHKVKSEKYDSRREGKGFPESYENPLKEFIFSMG